VALQNNGEEARGRRLRDFTITPQALRVIPLALLVGAIAAGVALALLRLIGLFTHLFYYASLGSSLIAPSTRRLGALSILVPVLGGLIVGLIARYGSERIRGHGIPEAMETILTGGSKVAPRLALLKPLASAIAIGSGGPFGAEGPIIMTGGAFGSLIAQLFSLTASERRTLLVAGSCAGMAAVFGTPLAAALFGVELLVFEWRPRSMVPIALAVLLAQAIRELLAHHGLIGAAPLFPVPHHSALPASGVAAAALVGLIGGLLAWLLTVAVYGAEDAFARLPIHWMWWPALGGLVVGLGGMVDQRALGVGYPTIGAALAGHLGVSTLVTLLVVKLVIWSLSLGSGTSGGILAPLLMMGGALGGILSPLLPGGGLSTWALIGIAATLAGVTRSPFTAVVFALELTGSIDLLPALLAASAIAHLLSTLLLGRSILTEKVARRGFHVMREYAVDPLEALIVSEVMTSEPLTTTPECPLAKLREQLLRGVQAPGQRLIPVLDRQRRLLGILTASSILHSDGEVQAPDPAPAPRAKQLMLRSPLTARPTESLRAVAERMAQHRIGALPVVSGEPAGAGRLLGIVSVFDLLAARERMLAEERHRERVIALRSPLPRARNGRGAAARCAGGAKAPPAR